MRKWMLSIMALLLMLTAVEPMILSAEEKKEEGRLPSHVLNISKDNTYPNSTEDQVVLEPSELSKELIEESEVKITNPRLIELLNETSLKPSPLAIGYRGEVYLGKWPLNYTSKETSINWEYQHINTNELNNQASQTTEKLKYLQKEEKHVKGGLTAKIDVPDQVKRMLLLEAQNNTNLPLSFHTVVGSGTKQQNSYAVPVNKIGVLQAYAPAVNEKGTVAFGEVYIQLKGSKKELVVKNIKKQGIGAWIPIQDHVSYSFQLK
ncbi:YfkD famly protein [Thalassobacillus devorans]|uniref:YfkD famly protein n=1 Tax=Thalassobacillus devorans TaxID=279813 RepID=UPI00048F3331|nr:YfkD famly protein [Thalassobacillus devorans]